MTEFLLYIQFIPNLWTLCAGIKSISPTLAREYIETQDYNNDFRLLIPKSGIKQMELAGSGVIDVPSGTDTTKKMIELFDQGSEFLARVQSTNLTIEGKFLLAEFMITSETANANFFNYKMSSSGEFQVQ